MLYNNFDQDREYLVNKFRNPVFDQTTGINGEILFDSILDVAEKFEAENLPKAVIKAKCFEYVCQNLEIDVNIHDCFPGFGSYNRKRRPLCHY